LLQAVAAEVADGEVELLRAGSQAAAMLASKKV